MVDYQVRTFQSANPFSSIPNYLQLRLGSWDSLLQCQFAGVVLSPSANVKTQLHELCYPHHRSDRRDFMLVFFRW